VELVLQVNEGIVGLLRHGLGEPEDSRCEVGPDSRYLIRRSSTSVTSQNLNYHAVTAYTLFYHTFLHNSRLTELESWWILLAQELPHPS